jgi:hypothetical protein
LVIVYQVEALQLQLAEGKAREEKMAAELAELRDTAAAQDKRVQSLLRDNTRLTWAGPNLQSRQRESRELQRQAKAQKEREQELLDRAEELSQREQTVETRDQVMNKRWKLYEQVHCAKAETEAAKQSEGRAKGKARALQSRVDEQDVIITELLLERDELTDQLDDLPLQQNTISIEDVDRDPVEGYPARIKRLHVEAVNRGCPASIMPDIHRMMRECDAPHLLGASIPGTTAIGTWRKGSYRLASIGAGREINQMSQFTVISDATTKGRDHLNGVVLQSLGKTGLRPPSSCRLDSPFGEMGHGT